MDLAECRINAGELTKAAHVLASVAQYSHLAENVKLMHYPARGPAHAHRPRLPTGGTLRRCSRGCRPPTGLPYYWSHRWPWWSASPVHSTAKFLLLLGAVALHLSIAITLDLAIANLGCLTFAPVIFSAELADMFPARRQKADLQGGGEGPRQQAAAARELWASRAALVAMGALATFIACHTCKGEWRWATHEQDRGLYQGGAYNSGESKSGEAFRGSVETVAFGIMYGGFGMVQDYQLPDWADRRDVHHVLETSVEVAFDDGSSGVSDTLSLTFDSLGLSSNSGARFTTRAVLLFSYLVGVTWNRPPDPADTAAICSSVAARIAQYFCREEAPRLLEDRRAETSLAVHAYMLVEKAASKKQLPTHLRPTCADGGVAGRRGASGLCWKLHRRDRFGRIGSTVVCSCAPQRLA